LQQYKPNMEDGDDMDVSIDGSATNKRAVCTHA
jgi:hypothetical protein